MSKLFPPPAPPYNAAEHLDRMKQEEPYDPWHATVLAVLCGIIFWGLAAAAFMGWMDNSPREFSDHLAAFIIGAVLSSFFAFPFLL